MQSFQINGGKRLSGEIVPQGAKNEALQVICATLLTSEKVVIRNVPDISDVKRLIKLLVDLGVSVKRVGEGAYSFQAKDVKIEYIRSPKFLEQSNALRGSVMLMGPVLARYGAVYIPKPGGDKIGRRRIDTHIRGMQDLGAKYSYDYKSELFTLKAKKLRGTYILMDEASVTGTANIIMTAVLAHGKTTIFNAACEPYVVQLCKMLVKMGAGITGIGSNLLHIEGVKGLGGADHTLLPDMIEVGSFIGLAAMTSSAITIKNVNYQSLGIIPEVFSRLGITIERKDDDIFIPAMDHYEIENYIDGSVLTISDAPWPGFTPDLISVALVVATQARGSVLIHQKMFESRLFFVDKLIDMGAKIILCDPHRATVIGIDKKYPLRGIPLTSPDIRAGVAMLIASLSAEGMSVIHNIEQIDRGYQNIDGRLRKLGADIKRV